MCPLITVTFYVFSWAVIFCMSCYLGRHYIFTLATLWKSRHQKRIGKCSTPMRRPSVTILIPARNEEKVIRATLKKMTELTYPKDKLSIVVIDDGSTDETGNIADEFSHSFSNISVIHRNKNEQRHGKASALNDAMKRVKTQIIVCFDADYQPRSDIISLFANAFGDPNVVAVQGRVTVSNEPKNIVTRLVTLERIGGYRVDQQARYSLGLITQYGGTVGAFRKTLLDELGGWDEKMLAEDTDMTMRIYRAGYKIDYLIEAESYEEAVEGLRAYWRQRYRWSYGHMSVAFKHFVGVVSSRKLSVKQKIDAVLLLNIYFMPVLILFSWIITLMMFSFDAGLYREQVWLMTGLSVYGFAGNFAPFFEVGVGAYLDGRTRAQWLMPLLFFTFLLNVLICTKAFVDLLLSKLLRRESFCWNKTLHSGEGSGYVSRI